MIRIFIASLLLTSTGLLANKAPYLADGVKVGEVDTNSAIVWVRLTAEPEALFELLPIFTSGLEEGDKDEGDMPADVLPGMAGETQVVYWPAPEKAGNKISTDWESVSSLRDFTFQFHLKNLEPDTVYEYQVNARANDSSDTANTLPGRFKTAPKADSKDPVRFIVTTCQAIRSIDSGREGHLTYEQMLDFRPHFFVHTGDIVYYDKAPLAKSIPQARAKWNLMFAYGNNQYFHQNVSSYFMKDDHDTLKNDCWRGQTYGDLTFEQGLDIFREQVPMGDKTYRTYRWGKDLQIWMTENRDYRSANNDPNGPNKTILGEKQKAWLKQTLLESDATYKFVISPGPMVGPDKDGKKDNHANEVFAHEGQELRDFLSALPNTFVICGDRHWQYLSQDPKTGLLELGCGPINDEHNYGGDPGKVPEYHRYFSNKGGFLGITIENGKAKAEWYATNYASLKPSVRYTELLGNNHN
jgi:alkaline phosphatase D